jgi:hypothetical protein
MSNQYRELHINIIDEAKIVILYGISIGIKDIQIKND